MADSEAARLANVASYSTRNAMHGSPHLNHASVWAIYQRMVRKALQSVRPQPEVLDLGAGDGTASRLWIEAGAHLTAVDSSGEQLSRLSRNYPNVLTVESDGLDFLKETGRTFDIVSHVSMLHHIPDYLELLKASSRRVAPRGALVTFQDPLRYDRLPSGHYFLAQALYIPWRLSQGHVLRGIGNRIRRARAVYHAESRDDQEEYHVVRNGLDSDVIAAQLAADFTQVHVETYFSSQARLAQWAGDRLSIRSTFGIVATGRL